MKNKKVLLVLSPRLDPRTPSVSLLWVARTQLLGPSLTASGVYVSWEVEVDAPGLEADALIKE